ncbi:MAG TPA: ATP-binding protein [Vicinamibacterales bacterium]|nr:ATP-binding protein [Vicinamibacterales bacterium]
MPQPWFLSATPLATLPWLIRLRWTAALLDGVIVAVAIALPAADFPLRRIAAVIAISAVGHAVIAVRLSRDAPIPRLVSALMVLVEVALLTGLLELTGGPFNPFSVIFAVHVAFAALSLGAAAASVVALAAIGGYGVLVYWHLREAVAVHHELIDFPTHLFTLWVAMRAVAELAAYFVIQASSALARRVHDLELMRARAARSERLVSLTTLAAGAAHELSTPLGTIALAARELEHAAERDAAGAALIDDARLIRLEVDRCQTILDHMSGRAGGTAAEESEVIDVGVTIVEVVARLPKAQAMRVQVHTAAALPSICGPRSGFTQALLSLLTNALDASVDQQPVAVTAHAVDAIEFVRIAVSDRGTGMAPEVLSRAGEPFFTTKDAGRGLGLGLFLARVFAERCGGSLTITSDRGTTVTLDLPLIISTGPPE